MVRQEPGLYHPRPHLLFLDKTIKLWKVSERDKRAEGYNLKEDSGVLRDPSSITTLRVPVLKPMELMVEASPRRIFANAHTYHINSISVNSDQVQRDPVNKVLLIPPSLNSLNLI